MAQLQTYQDTIRQDTVHWKLLAEKKESTDQSCSQLFVVNCTNLAFMEDGQVESGRIPTVQHASGSIILQGELLFSRYREDGQNLTHSNLRRKPIGVLQKTWEWAGGSPSNRTATLNIKPRTSSNEYKQNIYMC